LLQVYPRTRKLAAVYNYGGERLSYVGDILKIEPEYLQFNKSLNNTYWDRDQNNWYCLFMYRPILRVFNKDFRLIRELTLQGPEIDEYEDKLYNKEKDPNFTTPWPHFTDFKVFE